jgi:hypothetical protein
MTLVFLIDQVAVPLYIILAALAALSFWRSLHARWQLSSTYYELERDLARQRFGTSIGWMVAFGLMILGVLGIQQTVAPFLRTELEQREIISVSLMAQDGDFRTATPAPLDGGLNIQPVAPLGENNMIILLTPTLTPTPVGTIIPNAPAAEGCQDPRATLQIPANGMRVFQPISVVGTAFTDSFAVAKLEISGPGTDNTYVVIDDRRQETREVAPFSQFAPAAYPPGQYSFRLTVFDITQQLVASCMVTIYITEPPVTPTPTPRPGA